MNEGESIAVLEARHKQLAEFAGLLAMRESLHPDLAACMKEEVGLKFIRHPLCCELHFPGTEAMMNRAFEQAKARLAKAEAKRDWEAWVFTHARAFRFDALLSLMGKDVSDAVWWTLVGRVWRDCENLYVNRDLWAGVWADTRDGREHSMTKADRRVLASLHKEDTVEVHRGVASKRGRLGLSWTLSEERAAWFARYRAHAAPGHVFSVRVPAHAILAYSNARAEEEVIIDLPTLRAIPARAFKRSLA